MNDMRVEPLVTVITLECRDMVEFIPTMQVGNKRERENDRNNKSSQTQCRSSNVYCGKTILN